MRSYGGVGIKLQGQFYGLIKILVCAFDIALIKTNTIEFFEWQDDVIRGRAMAIIIALRNSERAFARENHILRRSILQIRMGMNGAERRQAEYGKSFAIRGSMARQQTENGLWPVSKLRMVMV